jgi:hypothetical protein
MELSSGFVCFPEVSVLSPGGGATVTVVSLVPDFWESLEVDCPEPLELDFPESPGFDLPNSLARTVGFVTGFESCAGEGGSRNTPRTTVVAARARVQKRMKGLPVWIIQR